MAKKIFDFDSYRDYLVQWIKAQPKGGRGMRSLMAKHLNCHNAYISQVLQGDADFSLEQVFLLNGLIGHNATESHFFLLLLQYERATLPNLRAYFFEQLSAIRKENGNLTDRLDYEQEMNLENGIYYSSWEYSAVHVALSLRPSRGPRELAHYLGISPSRVSEIIEFLLRMKLLEESKGILKPSQRSVHLGVDSPFIRQHHTNWRLKALECASRKNQESLHYSSVISLSHNDQKIIRELFVEFIERIRSVVKESKEETLCCYNLDFFGVQSKGSGSA